MIDWIARLIGKESEQVCKEWHSWWIGWAEMICLRIPPTVPITDYARLEMKQEWHYFQVGRAAGVLTWVIILIGIFK